MDTSNDTAKNQGITIRDLYPHLSNDELKLAGENLDRYLELAVCNYARIRQDQDEYARFKTLTESSKARYDGEGQRSNYKSRT